MKLYAFILMCLGVWGLNTNVIAAANDVASNLSTIPVVNYDHSFTPSESLDAGIGDMSYSPDGHYLALYYQRPLDLANIVIWNMQTNKEQTRIEKVSPFLGSVAEHFLWAKDSSYFTFQATSETQLMRLYSPVDGHVIKEMKGICNGGLFNRDYTNLLCLVSIAGGKSTAKYRIYNTSDWSYRDYSFDNFITPKWLVWTADDRILAAGYSPRGVNTFDGISPQWADLVVRVFDPNGKLPSRSALLPAVAKPSALLGHVSPAYLGDQQVNFYSNKIANSSGLIVDIQSLKITTYLPSDTMVNNSGDYVANGFNLDGQYLYLLMGEHANSNTSIILDTNTGKTVATFKAAGRHMSIRPDGQQLAIAKGKHVELYRIQ